MSISDQKNLQRPTTEEILAYLRKIANETLELDSEQVSRIRPDSPLVETLLLDSLSQIELMVEIEEYYSFQFEPDDITQLNTVKDLVALIQARTNKG